jgi:1,2-phenylacetyl-CoA epoxidase PaaB subunit
MARWSVDIIGKRLKHIGTVVAANEEQAIEEAVKQS